MQDFTQKLTSIAVAQLLSMSGIDRVHQNCHQTLIEVLQKYLQHLASLVSKTTILTSRSKPTPYDCLLSFEKFEINTQDILEYLQIVKELKTKKQVPVHKFPRLEPSFSVN